MSNGNELRWDCEKQGCFNRLKRPKINVFHTCFPRGINFGDVDAIVEVGGRFILLEWKDHKGGISKGQHIMHVKMTAEGRHTVVIRVCGNAETMDVSAIQIVAKGKCGAWEECDLERLKGIIRRMANYADRNPV